MKNNKKGFTIVELVIVIAVIAILAAVLIPTFSNVIAKAKDSAALQEARNVFTNYMVDHAEEGAANLVVKIDDAHIYAIKDGKFVEADGKITVYTVLDTAETAVYTTIPERTGYTGAWTPNSTLYSSTIYTVVYTATSQGE